MRLASEQAIGQNIDLIVPADRHLETRQILDQIARGELIKHHETVRHRKDGSEVLPKQGAIIDDEYTFGV